MSTSSFRIAVVAIPLAVLVLVSGCAGADSPPGGGVTPSRQPSPLEPYWEVLYGAASPEAQAEKDAAIQNAVAACMKEEGFDYSPDVAPEGTFFAVDDAAVPWGSEEFATTYGYGVSTDAYADMAGGDDYVDPNAEYVASLSEGEQTAYSDALWGAPQFEEGGDPDDVSVDYSAEYDWRKGGCMGAAQHEFGSEMAADDPEFSSLIEGMEAIYEEVQSSPAVTSAERQWSDCLASAGFPGYEGKDDPMHDFTERFGALHPAVEEGSAAPTPDPEALEALQQEEIATATADFACSESSEYTATLEAEQLRLEQAFVDEHREQLDALSARYGAE
ncbi:hypothetical protein [Herbiconiux liukaitaii]|uniref:hypothetical protein n=1 Tax=Herbiconiux liukaitaii TaxID=3342799 RepID=UPI0035B84C42